MENENDEDKSELFLVKEYNFENEEEMMHLLFRQL